MAIRSAEYGLASVIGCGKFLINLILVKNFNRFKQKIIKKYNIN